MRDFWSDPQWLVVVGSATFAFIAVLMYVLFKARTSPYPDIVRHEDEQYYYDPNTGTKEPFPSLNQTPRISLSVIVPAYNEEKRLPAMLNECLEYLENRAERDATFRYEVIIVSDGSTDGTLQVGYLYSKEYTTEVVRVLALATNRGKGGAVRLGMMSSRGSQLLFADADGATKFADLQKLETEMRNITPLTDWENPAIVIGSRAHLEAEAITTRHTFRTFLMYGFQFLVWLFAVRGIRDTQCGFKLFTRSAAQSLFGLMHVERWAFDVELLYLARALNIRVHEVNVNWIDVNGSKITPIWSWLEMGRDLFLIWFRYAIGAWRYTTSREQELNGRKPLFR